MLFDVTTIVLRETLEAGVLISLLLTIGRDQRLIGYWVIPALLLGSLGAWIYTVNLGVVSVWFDYVGQEVVDSVLQYSIFFCLLAVVGRLRRTQTDDRSGRTMLCVLMTVTIALALVREGAEVMVFFSGYLQLEQNAATGFISGIMGLAIGLCVGSLVYYAITMTPSPWRPWLQLVLLTGIGVGMVMQATQLMLQGDLLPATDAVWDSSDWLSESSIPGQFAYAVFGYEATPSWTELGLALLALAVFAGAAFLLPKLLSQSTERGQ